MRPTSLPHASIRAVETRAEETTPRHSAGCFACTPQPVRMAPRRGMLERFNSECGREVIMTNEYKPITLRGVALPSGWRHEDVSSNQITICAPGPSGGYVTIDFDRRGFRSGYCVSGRMASEGTYAGRGWQQALVAAAIKWLDSVISP